MFAFLFDRKSGVLTGLAIAALVVILFGGGVLVGLSLRWSREEVTDALLHPKQTAERWSGKVSRKSIEAAVLPAPAAAPSAPAGGGAAPAAGPATGAGAPLDPSATPGEAGGATDPDWAPAFEGEAPPDAEGPGSP